MRVNTVGLSVNMSRPLSMMSFLGVKRRTYISQMVLPTCLSILVTIAVPNVKKNGREYKSDWRTFQKFICLIKIKRAISLVCRDRYLLVSISGHPGLLCYAR